MFHLDKINSVEKFGLRQPYSKLKASSVDEVENTTRTHALKGPGSKFEPG
jgi:hypothetical protein